MRVANSPVYGVLNAPRRFTIAGYVKISPHLSNVGNCDALIRCQGSSGRRYSSWLVGQRARPVNLARRGTGVVHLATSRVVPHFNDQNPHIVPFHLGRFGSGLWAGPVKQNAASHHNLITWAHFRDTQCEAVRGRIRRC